MGTALSESATIRLAEKAAERGKHQALERIHRTATRARDAAIIARANEDVEGRRSAEKIAEEQKLRKENEELLRREATAKLGREQKRRVHVEEKSRAAQAVPHIYRVRHREVAARFTSDDKPGGRRNGSLVVRWRRKGAASSRSYSRVTTID